MITFKNRFLLLKYSSVALLLCASFNSFADSNWSVHLGDLSQSEIQSDHIIFEPLEKMTQGFSDYRGDLWYKFSITKSELPQVQDLGVYIGRIRDADVTFWNGERIGGIGLNQENSRFIPDVSRIYRISRIKDQNVLLIHVKKMHISILGIGPSENKPIFGSFKILENKAILHDFIRIWIPLLFGFAILVLGFYQLFLFFYLKDRKDYARIGGTLICFGIYAICFSYWPYEVFPKPEIIILFHVMGAFWALYFFSSWFLSDRLIWIKLQKPFLGITLIYSFLSIFFKSVDQRIDVFLAWHPVLFLLIFIFFTILLNGFLKTKTFGLRDFAPFIAFASFFGALIYDTLVSRQVIKGEQWSIPTFLAILGIIVFIFFLPPEYF